MIVTSVTPRQRTTSGSAYPYPGEIPYEYPAPLAHGPNSASRHDPQYPQTGPNDYTQHGAHDWHADSQHRFPDTGQKHGHRGTRQRADSNAQSSSAIVANTRESGFIDWGSSRPQDDGTRDTSSRRPTRASISDRSEATASSWSDASSPRSISQDLQGLSLGDHPSSQLIPPHGASHRSQRWDPILGDVQRHHDTLVVSFIPWVSEDP